MAETSNSSDASTITPFTALASILHRAMLMASTGLDVLHYLNEPDILLWNFIPRPSPWYERYVHRNECAR